MPPGSRLVVPALAIVFAATSLIGRLDRPAPTGRLDEARTPSPPDTIFISRDFSPPFASEPQMLDLVTGAVGQWPRLKDSRLQVTAISPWVDGAGRRQIVGRQVADSDASVEVVLARYLLPEARLLDRMSPDFPPRSPPCWDPSGAARVLYVGVDRGLYRVDFGDGSATSSVSEIPWESPGRSLVGRAPSEISWFRGEDSRSYLIAAVSDADPVPSHRSRLWWLRLDDECRAIEDAGPLIGPSDQGWYHEAKPATSTGGDRPPVLAFLGHRARGEGLDLFTAEIRTDPTSGRPRIGRDDARRVSRDCAAWPPVFSPDGRHLYSMEGRGRTPRFTRHDVHAGRSDIP